LILEIKVCTNPGFSFNNGLDNTGQGAVREPPSSVIASKIDPLLFVLNLGRSESFLAKDSDLGLEHLLQATLKKLIFSCFVGLTHS